MADSNRPNPDRRDFVRVTAAGLGASFLANSVRGNRNRFAATPGRIAPPPPSLPAADPLEVVRIGFVGVGGMGGAHVRNLLRIPGVEIKALCDINAARLAQVQGWVTDAGFERPTGYFRGERDFERMCAEEELDLVYNATPWRWHVPIQLAAMRNDKHSATEVPAALTVDDCWELVETAESTGKHCVMMENVNYGRPELLVFNMVRQGMFGELQHAECGYLHDLRAIKFARTGEGLWRREHSKTRNGNLYPTHGLGPISQCMDINRGDRYDYLVSMSSPSRGLQLYAQENFRPGASQRSETFELGDVNVSLIKTAQGRTIFLSHDTNLPRPYSRIHMLQGTRGLFQGYPDRLHIEGRSPAHRWEEATEYYDEFEHPLWTALREAAVGAGHGGMDYLEDYRLIQCLLDGTPTDMNVYDAASMSVVSPLTEHSVANGSEPIAFPDFTRGRWRTFEPLEVVDPLA